MFDRLKPAGPSAANETAGPIRRRAGLDWRTIAWSAAWSAALLALLHFTNLGVVQRLQLLLANDRLDTLIGFLGIWGLSLVCLMIVAWQGRVLVRAAWCAAIAVATAGGIGFRAVSGADLTVFDAVSLWSVRHEAARAASFYGDQALWPAVAVAATILLIMTAPRPSNSLARRWISRLALAPSVPIAAIAAIIVLKEGGGTQSLPVQFTPLSIGLVTGATLAMDSAPQRDVVGMQPGAAMARSIVVLIDESVRADMIDFGPGSETTPLVRRHGGRIVDFGTATSGGTCSHYSNAILRFTARPSDLGGGILRNPTIWNYAKKAGFETVYIDAQSAFNKNPGKLQNFMTVEEVAEIDRFHTIDDTVPAHQLDFELLEILRSELSSGKPKLIYANKNGAHFPYDSAYPPAESVFRPTISESVAPGEAEFWNSYKNTIRWSVDTFFAQFLDAVRLSDGVVIYTSDHGQNLDPDASSHCSVEDPDPWEGLVPLFTVTDNPELKRHFRDANRNPTPRSHFEIVPTVLVLMGYPEAEVRREKGNTLLEPGAGTPAFSSGDIFGLFSKNVRWHEVEPEYFRLPSGRTGPIAARADLYGTESDFLELP